MPKWPRDTQADRVKFYGDPGKGQIEARLVPVVPPFAMYYDGKRVKSIKFHKLAAPALIAALNEIWDYCDHDQAKIDAAGVSDYNGAFNQRKVRGSATKWSNHAFGCAIDLDADDNGLGKKGDMPQFVIDAFCRQGAMWGGWYKGRKDPMHFEFVDNGGRKPQSAPPVWPKPVTLGLVSEDEPPRVTDDLEEVAPAAPVPPAPPPPQDDAPGRPAPTKATPIEEGVQRALDRMGYSPGTVGDKAGGMTVGAIAAFKNDRHMNGEPVIDDALLAELNAAEAEGFRRPIAAQRAEATETEIGKRVPAVASNWWSRQWAKVLAIPSAIGAAVSGMMDSIPAAKEYVAPVKDFFSDMPGWVWFVLIGAIGFGIWHTTRKTAEAAQQDFKEGRRL